jgi:hypothetical protein
MKFTYSISSEANTVNVLFEGAVTPTQVADSIDLILADPEYRVGMSSLCDMRNALIDWSLKDIDVMRSFVQSIRSRVGHAHWAIISGGGPADFTARLFMLLHEAYDKTIIIRLFKTLESAQVWVDQANASPLESSPSHESSS